MNYLMRPQTRIVQSEQPEPVIRKHPEPVVIFCFSIQRRVAFLETDFIDSDSVEFGF